MKISVKISLSFIFLYNSGHDHIRTHPEQVVVVQTANQKGARQEVAQHPVGKEVAMKTSKIVAAHKHQPILKNHVLHCIIQTAAEVAPVIRIVVRALRHTRTAAKVVHHIQIEVKVAHHIQIVAEVFPVIQNHVAAVLLGIQIEVKVVHHIQIVAEVFCDIQNLVVAVLPGIQIQTLEILKTRNASEMF